ncbi:MAG TPA: hypothetical protein VMW41_00225 [Candidatus Bathyarchaeia archaeon]|nr:hypothetical protein [Candidatus Bathyarchaeia archaeon]
MEKARIRINGFSIHLHKQNINSVTTDLLLLIDLFSSDEAMRENIEGILKIMEEYKPALSKKRKIIKKIKRRETLIKFYFDLILSLSQMSTLRGFSCICKAELGRSNYDPEKYRMTEEK